MQHTFLAITQSDGAWCLQCNLLNSQLASKENIRDDMKTIHIYSVVYLSK
jgi:hypothetical protein